MFAKKIGSVNNNDIASLPCVRRCVAVAAGQGSGAAAAAVAAMQCPATLLASIALLLIKCKVERRAEVAAVSQV